MKLGPVTLAACVALLTACGGSSDAGGATAASTQDGFTLTGPVTADGRSESHDGGCQWKPSAFDLSFTSGKMQNGVQVAFSVTVGIGGIGDESATTPLIAGHTPLVLMANGKTIAATDGTVRVTDADLSGRHWKGTVEGTFADGTKIAGPWSCTAPIGG